MVVQSFFTAENTKASWFYNYYSRIKIDEKQYDQSARIMYDYLVQKALYTDDENKKRMGLYELMETNAWTVDVWMGGWMECWMCRCMVE
jgi:hypothetical protein